MRVLYAFRLIANFRPGHFRTFPKGAKCFISSSCLSAISHLPYNASRHHRHHLPGPYHHHHRFHAVTTSWKPVRRRAVGDGPNPSCCETQHMRPAFGDGKMRRNGLSLHGACPFPFRQSPLRTREYNQPPPPTDVMADLVLGNWDFLCTLGSYEKSKYRPCLRWYEGP